MTSSQVQMASAHFGCVLRDHNWRLTDKERESNDSSVRAQQLEKNLKDFVRDHIKSCIALSGSRDSDENSENQVDNQEKNDHNFKGPGRRDEEPQVDDESSSLAVKHSKIVDRWATRKAREMIITIERQTHEAELLALSNSHPVSTVASSFLAESPRTPSECSVDLPNLHTSSLLQMWREFEAEKKPTSGNHISFNSNSTISSGGRLDSGTGNLENAPFVDDPSPRSEVCDSGDERYETPAAHEDPFTDWESEQNGATASEQLSSLQDRVSDVGRLSEVGKSERPRVADIVRKLTSGKPKPSHSSMTPSTDEPDQEQPTVIDPVPEGGEQRGFLSVGKSPRVRGRQAMMDLLMQMERERQRELNELVERRAVSQFAQRGRIQSMLKLRLLQRGVAALDQQSPASAASELGRLHQGTNILALRRKFSPYRDAGEVHGGESGGNSNSHTRLPDNTTDSGHSGASNEVINEEVHHQEVATMEQESITPMHHSIPSIREDLQEEASQSIDYARQGICLMVCDLAQEGSINNATTSHDSEGNGLTEEPEPDTEQLVGSTDGTWLGDGSHLHKNWRGSTQSWYQDLLPTNSEDVEWNIVTDVQEPGMQQFTGSTNGTWLGDVSSSQSGWRHSRQAWHENVVDNNAEDRERIFVTEEPEYDMLQLAESADGTWLSDGLHPQTDWRGQSWYQNAVENNSEDEEEDVVTDEPDLDSEQLEGSTDGTWLGDVSHPPRDWRRSRQEWCQEVLENSSENEEIRELLQRRSVTRFLASDLRETMDQMIMSCIQRRRHQSESVAEEENHFEHPYSETSGTSDHFAPTSFNLPLTMSYNLPLPYQLRPQNWYQDHEATRDNSERAASTSLQPSEYQSRDNLQSAINHPSLEMDLISDLREHMVQLHNEIYELRKSMESCMDMQNKIQHYIKKEVSAAVYHSVHGGEATELHNWVPTTKGKCCICYDMQVDSLLYRCGHMCTCFKCAHELQWSSGRCPICRAPILDVVRAYSNS